MKEYLYSSHHPPKQKNPKKKKTAVFNFLKKISMFVT